jgi:streptogramin lyase
MNRKLLVGIATLAVLVPGTAAGRPAPGPSERSGPGVSGKVPCAKLKKRHKPLPARCRKPKPPPPAPKPTGPPVLGTVTATIEIPGETTTVNPGSDSDTGGMVYGAGSLWTVDTHGLVRIDPATNAVIARVPGPSGYGGIVFGDGAVWYSSWDAGAVLRVDPATNAIVATVPVPAGPEELAALPGSVWVASHYDWSASRIDTATNRVVATVRMPGEYPGCCGPQGIAAGEGGVWVAVPGLGGTNLVVRIDPVTNAVSAAIGGTTQTCGPVLAAAGAVWVTNAGCGGPGVARIDPATNGVVVRGIGDMIRVTDAVAVNGSVYFRVSVVTDGIERVDPATNTVTGILEIRGLPAFGAGRLAYGAGSLWARAPARILRVQLTG